MNNFLISFCPFKILSIFSTYQCTNPPSPKKVLLILYSSLVRELLYFYTIIIIVIIFTSLVLALSFFFFLLYLSFLLFPWFSFQTETHIFEWCSAIILLTITDACDLLSLLSLLLTSALDFPSLNAFILSHIICSRPFLTKRKDDFVIFTYKQNKTKFSRNRNWKLLLLEFKAFSICFTFLMFFLFFTSDKKRKLFLL